MVVNCKNKWINEWMNEWMNENSFGIIIIIHCINESRFQKFQLKISAKCFLVDAIFFEQ